VSLCYYGSDCALSACTDPGWVCPGPLQP
jgi:hypothetical protein